MAQFLHKLAKYFGQAAASNSCSQVASRFASYSPIVVDGG